MDNGLRYMKTLIGIKLTYCFNFFNLNRHLPIGYYGSYKNGMKIGKWVTKYFELNTVMQSDQDIM